MPLPNCAPIVVPSSRLPRAIYPTKGAIPPTEPATNFAPAIAIPAYKAGPNLPEDSIILLIVSNNLVSTSIAAFMVEESAILVVNTVHALSSLFSFDSNESCVFSNCLFEAPAALFAISVSSIVLG